MTRLDTILERMKQVTRVEILKDFRRDSCIGSTRVVIRVLKHFGYEAVPFPCVAFIYNKGYTEAILRGEQPPENKLLRNAWLDARKAWSIGLGINNEGGESEGEDSKVGHVVAVLPKQKLMVDAMTRIAY